MHGLGEMALLSRSRAHAAKRNPRRLALASERVATRSSQYGDPRRDEAELRARLATREQLTQSDSLETPA
jgi:hypothetical protein